MKSYFRLPPMVSYIVIYISVLVLMPSLLKAESKIFSQDSMIVRSIYSEKDTQKSNFYNFLWGKHCRGLYSIPIKVPIINLEKKYGGLSEMKNVSKGYGLLLQNKRKEIYLLRLLGGYTTFLDSDFFNRIYIHKEYKKTYIGDFIKDAYTITNPYMFIVTDQLAEKVELNSIESRIVYIPNHEADSMPEAVSEVEGHLVSLYNLNSFIKKLKIISSDSIKILLEEGAPIQVDSVKYIRERLFNMLVGNWNISGENQKWLQKYTPDSTQNYSPIIVERTNSFTKVDGFFFKGILSMFGLSNISNYDYNYGDLKKLNKFSLPFDIALVGNTSRNSWLKEATYLQTSLTNQVIDSIFQSLPEEIKGKDSEEIKIKLKSRRDKLKSEADQYYTILQKTPVIRGTKGSDSIQIERKDDETLSIKVFDPDKQLVLNKIYDKKTKEVWLYGLDGNDVFSILGEPNNPKNQIILVGGKGKNSYQMKSKKRTKIYEYKSFSDSISRLTRTKTIQTDLEKVHTYDVNKLKYATFDFTPWGIYDSDLGLYLGIYFTRTMYGFKRSPYSYRHRIGYNYLNGFMYQGFFPSYDEKKNFIIEGFVGTPNNFVNFFGYGNETEGFRNEGYKYNRVNMSKYSLAPSFTYKLKKHQKIALQTGIEIYRLSDSRKRYVNFIYDKDDIFFKTKTFADFNLQSITNLNLSPFMPRLDYEITAGWKINLGDMKRNYTYLETSLKVDFKLGHRLTLASALLGEVLFTDKYEFYQAASTELRGYRSNRFIGNKSIYQSTDLRLDLGPLDNPFVPVLYGVFGGLDYGRVWYPGERSKKWHNSYGGGFWLTLFKSYTGKFSYFCSKDGNRFSFGLGLGF